jgi:tagatose-1,6-bisphosphate aldolase non-catalytic subunit AgaZ/GatZ
MFILLHCWYDGDSNLVDDSFVACSESAERLIEHANSLHTDHLEELQVFLIGTDVPDDGAYGDKRVRYKIVEVEPI